MNGWTSYSSTCQAQDGTLDEIGDSRGLGVGARTLWRWDLMDLTDWGRRYQAHAKRAVGLEGLCFKMNEVGGQSCGQPIFKLEVVKLKLSNSWPDARSTSPPAGETARLHTRDGFE